MQKFAPLLAGLVFSVARHFRDFIFKTIMFLVLMFFSIFVLIDCMEVELENFNDSITRRIF